VLLVRLSVRPFLCRVRASNSTTKTHGKAKIGVNVHQGRSLNRQIPVKKYPENDAYFAYMFTYGWWIRRWLYGRPQRPLHTRPSAVGVYDPRQL